MKLDHIDWRGPEPVAVFHLGGRGCVEPMTQNLTVKGLEDAIGQRHQFTRQYKLAIAEIKRGPSDGSPADRLIEPNSIASGSKFGTPEVTANGLDWGTW